MRHEAWVVITHDAYSPVITQMADARPRIREGGPCSLSHPGPAQRIHHQHDRQPEAVRAADRHGGDGGGEEEPHEGDPRIQVPQELQQAAWTLT